MLENVEEVKIVGTFSSGMKCKVLIAIALLGDPEVCGWMNQAQS